MPSQKKCRYIKLLLWLAATPLTAQNKVAQQPVPTKLTTQSKIELAITVDDLPCYEDRPLNVSCLTTAKKLIAGLKKHKVPEVFGFMNAKTITEHVDGDQVIKEWLAAGFPLGSHTYSHPNVDEVSTEYYFKDINKNEEILRKYTLSNSIKYFRGSVGNFVSHKTAIL